MPLLISDANIIIDLIDGEILPLMFDLNYEFATSDILHAEELDECQYDLIELGLNLIEVNEAFMIQAAEINSRHAKISMKDSIVLALAMQEQCPLLTGDRPLRAIAESMNIEVRGTLWLVQEMYNQEVITKVDATIAYEKMRLASSRLPWDMVAHQLANME